jgi:hypothetical protein
MEALFTPKNLLNSSPGGTGPPKSGTDGLNVIVILRQKAPRLLKYFSLFQYISVDSKLLATSQCGHVRHLQLLFLFNPNLALFQEPVVVGGKLSFFTPRYSFSARIFFVGYNTKYRNDSEKIS